MFGFRLKYLKIKAREYIDKLYSQNAMCMECKVYSQDLMSSTLANILSTISLVQTTKTHFSNVYEMVRVAWSQYNSNCHLRTSPLVAEVHCLYFAAIRAQSVVVMFLQNHTCYIGTHCCSHMLENIAPRQGSCPC